MSVDLTPSAVRLEAVAAPGRFGDASMFEALHARRIEVGC